jgi:uncharacterized membrane protein/thiol-disulfide isomerase/thioredoxin
MKRVLLLGISLILLLNAFTGSGLAQEQGRPIVQAVLFHSPSCPHCHIVIDDVLPPLVEQYGDQLQIAGIDTSKAVGQQLYQNAIAAFNVPANRTGVPALYVGDVLLVGSQEIPDQFPGIIEAGLAGNGIGWPAIPGLREALPNLPPSADPNALEISAPVVAAPATTSAPTAAEPAASSGFALAWAVMIGMVAALVYAAWQFGQRRPGPLGSATARTRLGGWPIAALTLVGLMVAGYLAYVELTQVQAVCGPVGECNIVQASPYAQIMGIPVAVLGLINYLAIGGLWLLVRKPETAVTRLQQLAPAALLAITVFGVLFSIYLTALELFVIHAVCAWCLTSAVITTLMMVIVVGAVTRGDQPAGQAAHAPAGQPSKMLTNKR